MAEAEHSHARAPGPDSRDIAPPERAARHGPAVSRLRAAAPYLVLALALLAGSVLASLYWSSAKDDAAAKRPVTAAGDGEGGVAESPQPSPSEAAADRGRSQATRDPSALGVASIDPRRVTGTVTVAGQRGSRAAAPKPLRWDALGSAFYELGYAQQRQGATDQALASYRRAAELDSVHAATFYNWGYILQQQGQIDAAIEKYHAALDADAEHFWAHYNLGYLLQSRGEMDEAIDQYRRAAALDRTNPYVWYNWAYILEGRGETSEALRLYARALEIDPDHRPGTSAQERIAGLYTARLQQPSSPREHPLPARPRPPVALATPSEGK